jgi:hypothetical protein
MATEKRRKQSVAPTPHFGEVCGEVCGEGEAEDTTISKSDGPGDRLADLNTE